MAETATPDSVLQQYALEFLLLDTRPTFIVDAGLRRSDTERNYKTRFENVSIFENRAFIEQKTCALLRFVEETLLPSARSRSEYFEGWKFNVVSMGRSVSVVTLSPAGNCERPPNSHPFDHSRQNPDTGERVSGIPVTCIPADTESSKGGSGKPHRDEASHPNPLARELSENRTEISESECKPEAADLRSHHTNISSFGMTGVGGSPLPSPKKQPEKGLEMDWTKGQILHETPHFRDLLQVDWASTPCGPLASWGPGLRQIANGITANPFPTSLYWGPEYIIIYNERWKTIAQQKNPTILGKGFKEGWPELKDSFLPLLDRAFFNGETILREAEPLFLQRMCELEETYFDFAITPVLGESGCPHGVMQQAFEVTRQVISQRRMHTVERIADTLADVRDLDRDYFCEKLSDAFEDNPLDSPFLLVYRYSEEDEKYILEGNVGVPQDGNLAPRTCVLGNPDRGYFTREMQTAKETNSVVLKALDQQADVIRCRGFGESSSHAAVIPIQATSSMSQGFLILGLNPRRPFDDDYKLWIHLLKKEIATTVGRVRLLKDEITQAISQQLEKTARQQAVDLQEQLQKRTEELRSSELLFTKIAETIPVGLVLMDKDGHIRFANEAYKNLSKDSPAEDWRNAIYKEDVQRVHKSFDDAIATHSNLHLECRCGNDFGPQGWQYWVSCSVIAQRDEISGEVQGFMLTLVDITSIKLNEEFQRKLSTDAVERRRQQENFIDIFSHELRNPFSATLQCADGILSALVAYQADCDSLDVEELIDSASTILVCVQHQMRIIDDVLTLSKLDSMLLSVVPVDVEIHDSVSQILRIFQSELQAKGIKSQYIIEDSYKNINVEWVKADPSRFSQILVNLLTNAIKFTSLQKGKREITVTLGASLKRPAAHGDVVYNQDTPDGDLQDVTSHDWGDGEPVYIMVTVKDSGIGISQEWQKKLFKRFEQVPKTHVTYGGSGLGLFICRQLCRIQGGEIGVYSEEGHGSSFAFYIKARRVVSPKKQLPEDPHREAPSLEGRSFEKLVTGSTDGEPTVVALKAYPSSVQKYPKAKTSTPANYRVLVVEDNLINQEVLRRQLNKEGCVTYVAGNGKEALEIVTQSSFGNPKGQPIDIVLMDMEMPVMDGNTATIKIREMQKSGNLKRHVPIMGISANARREQVAKMTQAGMDDAISKPFRIADLLERFSSLLEKLAVKPGQ